VAFSVYLLLVQFDLTLALSAFMTAIAPTAIAAPVIIGFIHREVEYVVAAVLITNLSSALIVPLALPSLIGTDVQITVWEVLQPVLVVMLAPLILALLVSTAITTSARSVYSQRENRFRFQSGWSTFLSSAPMRRILCAMKIPILRSA
jgi:predicted Na+-dependent transporter